MSLTEVGRLAIGKNCFHCAVKDATSSPLWDKHLE